MIQINNLITCYRQKQVLNGISIGFTQNQFTFICGPNGAGKSTLLKSMNGIKAIKSGDILIQEKNIKDWEEKSLARVIAFIPQEFSLQFDFRVFEFVLMARYPWLDYFGRYSENDYQIVEKYLKQLNLTAFEDRYFNQLSGGEKQRVLITRALVQDTPIILMDESLSSLDINHQVEILTFLKKIIANEYKTIIIVSHNLNLAAEFADTMIFLKNGEIIAHGDADNIFNEELLSKVFDMQIRMITNPYTGKRNYVHS